MVSMIWGLAIVWNIKFLGRFYPMEKIRLRAKFGSPWNKPSQRSGKTLHSISSLIDWMESISNERKDGSPFWRLLIKSLDQAKNEDQLRTRPWLHNGCRYQIGDNDSLKRTFRWYQITFITSDMRRWFCLRHITLLWERQEAWVCLSVNLFLSVICFKVLTKCDKERSRTTTPLRSIHIFIASCHTNTSYNKMTSQCF